MFNHELYQFNRSQFFKDRSGVGVKKSISAQLSCLA